MVETIQYGSITYKVIRGSSADGYSLHLIPCKTRQDITAFTASGYEILGLVNANYFDLNNGTHYGVEQDNLFRAYTQAPKQSGLICYYIAKDGTPEVVNAADYWLTQDDVQLAVSPYAVLIHNGAECIHRSTALSNKDSTRTQNTFFMKVGADWCIGIATTACKPSDILAMAKSFGATELCIMDGGGSTQMVADGAKVYYTGRKLPNVLALVRKKKATTSSSGSSALTPESWMKSTLGKAYDVDGAYGNQCWDYFAKFNKLYTGLSSHCALTGYVCDLWRLKDRYGYSKSYEYITDPAKLQPGDWLIWDKGSSCKLSHVAMLVKLSYKASGYWYGIIQGQNQGGYGVTQKAHRLDIIGAFRFKGWQKEKNTMKTNEQIAWEVWHGQWGSGDDRKAKLTAAGYDYSAIQELVNQGVGKSGEYPAGDTTDYKAKYEALQAKYDALQKTNQENLQTANELKKDYEARIAAAISALNGGSK